MGALAVWLRLIEYFEGVLFLTSNRIKDFDDAFRSRIHLAIGLPDLDANQRERIWKGLIDFNKQATFESRWTSEVYKALGMCEINVSLR